MTAERMEALTIEQDTVREQIANVTKNAHMFSSGQTVFNTLRRLRARYYAIDKELNH